MPKKQNAFMQNEIRKKAVIFSKIYENNDWENGSGRGSKYENCIPYVNFLHNFLKEYKIQSILDVGCGDWQFSRYISWGKAKYLGIDCVPSLIIENNLKYSNKKVRFECRDFSLEKTKKADLLILKDVLQHLCTANIESAILNFRRFKYVLVTNDSYDSPYLNQEITDGEYRPLDLTKFPFFLQGELVLEFETEGDSKKTYLFRKNSIIDCIAKKIRSLLHGSFATLKK